MSTSLVALGCSGRLGKKTPSSRFPVAAPGPSVLVGVAEETATGGLVPPEDCQSLFDKAGEPKKMVTLPGVGHYEVYVPPAFDDVMKETVAWFEGFLPAR